KNARKYGYSCKKIDNSYGYDAQFISEIVPTALIFIPCKKEASLFKENCVQLDDWVKCTNVILKTIIDIDKNL
ncbi:N-carbamoyl-L-amino acid amidohydrolase, partial [human gut metagenome]